MSDRRAPAPAPAVNPPPLTAEIQTSGLVKTYGTRNVVAGVDVRVRAGEIVGLLGPNGAGKTTTARASASAICRRNHRLSASSRSRKTFSPSLRRLTSRGATALVACNVISRNLISHTSPNKKPTRFLAASAGVSKLPAHSLPARNFFCSTNLSPGLTPSQSPTCKRWF